MVAPEEEEESVEGEHSSPADGGLAEECPREPRNYHDAKRGNE